MQPGTFLCQLQEKHAGRITSMVQQEGHVWSASNSGGLFVHTRNASLVLELKIPCRGLTLDYATCMAVVGKEVWCGLSSGGICIYRDAVLIEEREDGHLGPITCMAYSESAGLVWTGGGDCKLLSWSVNDKARVGQLEGHSDWIRCLLVHKGKLWSGADDMTVRIWPESGNSVGATRVVCSHRGSVLCLAAVGQEVWSGSSDRQICRMDEAGAELGFLVGHRGRVMSFGVAAHQHCWAGCSDKRCVIWSLKTHRQLGEDGSFSGSIGVILIVDGWCAWTGTGDGVIRCWAAEVPPKSAWVPGQPPPSEPLLASPKEQQPQQQEAQLDAPSVPEFEEGPSPTRERRPRRQRKTFAAPGSPILAKGASARKFSLDLESPVVEEPVSSLDSSEGDGEGKESRRDQSQHRSRQHNNTNNHNRRHHHQEQHQHQQRYPSSPSVPSPSPSPSYPYPSSWYGPQQPPPPAPWSMMYPQPQVQPGSVVHVVAPPVQASQSPLESAAFIAHLRETNLQLRNSLATLQEKYDLLREQHHRQLLVIEEDQRRALERQRQELQLAHEREIRDVLNERLAYERKLEVSQAELKRVHMELEALKLAEQRSRLGSSRSGEDRAPSMEESLRVVQQQQQQLLQSLSSPLRSPTYNSSVGGPTFPVAAPPQQQTRVPTPDFSDLSRSLDAGRSSVEEMRRLNAEVLRRARQLGRK